MLQNITQERNRTEGIKWIQQAQAKVQMHNLVNTLMHHSTPYQVQNDDLCDYQLLKNRSAPQHMTCDNF